MGTDFTPVAIRDRIQTLDVVRGVALLGIALMNVEFFNRPLADLGAGMPADLSGIDYWASWFIHTFVRGKFWTMFSILFGMGFAVMLTRAQDAGRGFVVPYLRRALALAGFGLLHGILVWSGDILLSYATAALVLLLTLFGRFWHGLLAAALIAAVAMLLKMPGAMGSIAVLAIAGLVAAYLRGTREVGVFGRRWPLWSLVLAVVGLLLAIGGGIGLAIAGPKLGGLLFGGVVLLLLGWLSARFREPAGKRSLRAGATLYLAPFVAMTIGAAIALASPQGQPPKDKETVQAVEKRIAEQRKELAEETKVMSTGTYAQAVSHRAVQFTRDYVNQSGFVGMVLGLFLMGMWFVQSGAMVHPQQHLPLFRKLAFVGLPVGTALAVASSLIATHHVPNGNDVRWQLAMGLQMIGNLPMSLGYIAVVVLAMQGEAWRGALGWLAPMGRMALTNYLMQSVLGTLFFYGYGLGHWGMPRAQQVLYVLAVFALQVLLSRWWLSRFRFGPLEWVWRWITYGRRPALRIAAG